MLILTISTGFLLEGLKTVVGKIVCKFENKLLPWPSKTKVHKRCLEPRLPGDRMNTASIFGESIFVYFSGNSACLSPLVSRIFYGVQHCCPRTSSRSILVDLAKRKEMPQLTLTARGITGLKP